MPLPVRFRVTLDRFPNRQQQLRYPPTGRVRISAPLRMDIDTIRVFAVTKLGWIKIQQHKLHEQESETPCEYLEREILEAWYRE